MFNLIFIKVPDRCSSGFMSSVPKCFSPDVFWGLKLVFLRSDVLQGLCQVIFGVRVWCSSGCVSWYTVLPNMLPSDLTTFFLKKLIHESSPSVHQVWGCHQSVFISFVH